MSWFENKNKLRIGGFLLLASGLLAFFANFATILSYFGIDFNKKQAKNVPNQVSQANSFAGTNNGQLFQQNFLLTGASVPYMSEKFKQGLNSWLSSYSGDTLAIFPTQGVSRETVRSLGNFLTSEGWTVEYPSAVSLSNDPNEIMLIKIFKDGQFVTSTSIREVPKN